MLDGTEYIECACGSDEHTLRFTLDLEDHEVYVSTFLGPCNTFWQRLIMGIKYIFGYPCKFGHFENTIIEKRQAEKIIKLMEKLTTNNPGNGGRE